MSGTHKGQCFCGAVEIEVSGEPAGMGYCHCESCRHWSAGPVNAFTLWDPDKVRVVKGEEHLLQYNKWTSNFPRVAFYTTPCVRCFLLATIFERLFEQTVYE